MNLPFNRLTEYFFLILILSAFLIPCSNVLGAGAFGLQARTETLLTIVEKANDTIVWIYRELKICGFQIPQEALILYDEGLAKADEAFIIYYSGRYQEASRTAVEALQKFKESFYVTYNEIQESPTQIASFIETVKRYNNSITRGFHYLKYIENLAQPLKAKGFDTTVLEAKIQEARVLLNKALRELHQYRLKSVSEILVSVKAILSTLMERLEKISLDLKISRLEAYIVEADERLNLLEAKIFSLSSELSPEAQNASLTALKDAENNLDNAKSYLEVQMVAEVVEELVQSKESEMKALQIISENRTSSGSVTALETSVNT